MGRFTRRGALAGLAASPVLAAGWQAASAAAAPAAAPQPPSLDEFIAKPLARAAVLSPDGQQIAVVKVAEEGKVRKAFIDLMDAGDPDLKRRRVSLGDLDVEGLAWGANDRLLVSMRYETEVNAVVTGSRLGENFGSTKLRRTIAMGLDGDNQVALFGKSLELLRFNEDLTEIIDLLPDDPDNILMRAWDPTQNVWALYKVDIRTGLPDLMERGTLNTSTWWTRDGAPVLREDWNGSGTVASFYYRQPGQSVWKFVRKARLNELSKPDFDFLAPTPDPAIWLVSTTNDPGGARSVYKFDLTTMAIGDRVLAHADRDIDDCLLDSRRNLVGAAFVDDRIAYEFADASLAPHFRGVNAFFTNTSNVEIGSLTPDHNRMLAKVSSPTDPGGFYFYDRVAHRLQGLDATRPWLSTDRLAPVEILDVKARDGQALRAYLTAPLATGPRPLVVMPHGGPEARDSYDFDLIAQAFAAQGWMVLQPNFRGSGGYGQAFAQAGRRHWADTMQADVEDAVDQLLAAGRADPKRVAIWGGSYGGYASLMGAIRRPQLYRSAVSLAGVTDAGAFLAFQRRRDDDGISYDYWVKQLGDPKADAELIASESPTTHAAGIQVPVLLLHGTKDDIVDISQSRAMNDALKHASKSVQYVELKDAGHHLDKWDDKTLRTILQTSVDFIGKSFV
jgi:dipeptidyl aminopeptidase/acylaminoacyl peptidase